MTTTLIVDMSNERHHITLKDPAGTLDTIRSLIQSECTIGTATPDLLELDERLAYIIDDLENP